MDGMGQRGMSCLRCHILVHRGRQYGVIVPGQHHLPHITPSRVTDGTLEKGGRLLQVGFMPKECWHCHQLLFPEGTSHNDESFDSMLWAALLVDGHWVFCFRQNQSGHLNGERRCLQSTHHASASKF